MPYPQLIAILKLKAGDSFPAMIHPPVQLAHHWRRITTSHTSRYIPLQIPWGHLSKFLTYPKSLISFFLEHAPMPIPLLGTGSQHVVQV
jgi:hypothetical protein